MKRPTLRQRLARGTVCVYCDYDAGSSEVPCCPECGQAPPTSKQIDAVVRAVKIGRIGWWIAFVAGCAPLVWEIVQTLIHGQDGPLWIIPIFMSVMCAALVFVPYALWSGAVNSPGRLVSSLWRRVLVSAMSFAILYVVVALIVVNIVVVR